jgi:predicted TIM-barrel fold metal-dependent hydrolase
MVNMMDVVVRGVPERHPDLDFGFLEGGLSWVPMAMHRLDREYMQHRDGAPELTRRPSAYMKEFFVGSHPLETPADRTDLVRLIELIDGEDTIVFATDLPHHDFDHPAEVDKLAVDRAAKEAIWGDNAARWLGL